MLAAFIAEMPSNHRTPGVVSSLLGPRWGAGKAARAEALRWLRAYWGGDAED